MTISIAQGPLYQRASSVANNYREISGVTTLNMALALSSTYFHPSRLKHFPYVNGATLAGDVLQVVRNASVRTPVNLLSTGCTGDCDAIVKVSFTRLSLNRTHRVVYCPSTSLKLMLLVGDPLFDNHIQNSSERLRRLLPLYHTPPSLCLCL